MNNTDAGQDLMAKALSESTESAAMAKHFAGLRQGQVDAGYKSGYQAGYRDAMRQAREELEKVYCKYHKAEAEYRFGVAYGKNLADALMAARGKQWFADMNPGFRKEPTKIYQNYLIANGFTLK